MIPVNKLSIHEEEELNSISNDCKLKVQYLEMKEEIWNQTEKHHPHRDKKTQTTFAIFKLKFL